MEPIHTKQGGGLTSAVATGNSTYNFTFQYDRWGNMTCVINGNTNGPCPQYSFNSANNQITNSGYTYDAAGNLTQDSSTNPVQTYQWDAEGRLATVLQNGSTQSTSTFNAFGQGVESVWPPYSLTSDEVRDLAGRELGDYNATQGQWWDRDIRAVGRMVAQSLPGETYFLHANLLNSDTQITDYSGSVHTDFVYYPWQMWTHAGSVVDAHFAGFEQSVGPTFPTPFRQFSGDLGRWLSPDPLGGDITNPQSLNRYAYALNNPTTLTDPTGLDTICPQGSDEGSAPPCYNNNPEPPPG